LIGNRGNLPEGVISPTIEGTQPGQPYAKSPLSTGSVSEEELETIPTNSEELPKSPLDESPMSTYPSPHSQDLGIPNPGPSLEKE
jgi:hypothetical protein